MTQPAYVVWLRNGAPNGPAYAKTIARRLASGEIVWPAGGRRDRFALMYAQNCFEELLADGLVTADGRPAKTRGGLHKKPIGAPNLNARGFRTTDRAR